jgi:hypothetical protein
MKWATGHAQIFPKLVPKNSSPKKVNAPQKNEPQKKTKINK